MEAMGCVSEDELLGYVGRRLASDVLAQTESHLRECDLCRQLLAEIVRQPSAEISVLEKRRVGRYEVIGPIGAGGMGVVYAARDPKLDRKVALKVLRPEASPDAMGVDLRGRTLREAQAMAQLSHPNVLAVHDVGTSGEHVFLAMELVEGGTLADWLREKPRGWRDVLQMFLPAARGLAAAHAAGILHRDFKPENVLIGSDGRPRVTDFGLAGILAATRSNRTASTNAMAGSPAYMAPEQMRGDPLDARADMFSYCVALHEGLYGERPFAGDTLAELQRAIEVGELRRPRKGSGVPARLRRVLSHGLQAAPAERFQSMQELIAALERSQRPTRKAAFGMTIVAMAAAATAGVALSQRSASRVDDQIHSLLGQMEAEEDPGRLAVLEQKLDQLVDEARRKAGEARKRGGTDGEVTARGDQLDQDIRRLLRKFGAETYAVPPIFKERLSHHVDRLLRDPDLHAIYARKAKYWPLISKELTARGLPEEMGYVAWAESLFNPVAKSPIGSLGLWQFQPQPARAHGLRVDSDVDERADVAKSTGAAAQYLAELLADFGSDSFMLALASYNSGENKMRRALQVLAREPGGFGREKRDFWYLYRRKLLPKETREYVPKVLAAAVVGGNPKRYGLGMER